MKTWYEIRNARDIVVYESMSKHDVLAYYLELKELYPIDLYPKTKFTIYRMTEEEKSVSKQLFSTD